MQAGRRAMKGITSYLKLSIAAAVCTIVLKTLAWWVTGSVGLLSDALESFVNLGAAVFALAMVVIAQAPPDDDHPFGHGKAEYFSSGFEGLLILGAGLGIIWTAGLRLLAPAPIESLGIGVVLSLISSGINGAVAWVLLKAAREHDSIALEADGRHLMTDVWTSIGVAIGILFVPVTGWLWLDPVIAIAVALNISYQAWTLLRRSIDGLMDRALDEADRARIEQLLATFADDEVRFDHLRSRRAGGVRFCNFHMHLPGAWSLARAASRRAEVERALLGAVRGLRVTIEILPKGVEPLGLQDRAPETTTIKTGSD